MLVGFLLLIVALLLYFLLRHILIIVTIENQSMYPTLKDGERILALRHYPTRWLQKGLIVLVRGTDPTSPLYIKRIVGLGGEPIDGEGFPGQTLSVPPKHIYVLGDNRKGSIDSRNWGPLPAKNVEGVAIMKLPGAR